MKYTNFILTIIAILLMGLIFSILYSQRYDFLVQGGNLLVFDKITGDIYITGTRILQELRGEDWWIKFQPTKRFIPLKPSKEFFGEK